MLGYSDTAKAIRTHCKGVAEMSTPSAGGMQMTKIIPRSDVFRLITKSKLPAAEKFEKWVFEEVLPGIYETGSYHMNPAQVMANVLADPRNASKLLLEFAELQEENALLTDELMKRLIFRQK